MVGNGIAGVTAADHLRRRHPGVKIDLIAEEPHHLYNRMGISRLVYGRRAMQGLYLNPDTWYDERAITTWLNTRALWIDRTNRQVALGTGEKLDYDRLILASGSRSFVPPIEGFGAPGTGVLRNAADAMALRAYAQKVGSRRGVVAGGGLLGLEAAYALHKLGLKTTVLERSGSLLAPPARPARRRAAAHLPRGPRPRDRRSTPRSAPSTPTAACAASTSPTAAASQAQILLVAAGISPTSTSPRTPSCAINRGVIVDDRMRTDDPHIFAAGDVAEFEGQVPGLWPTAVAQAEVAADERRRRRQAPTRASSR